MLWDTHMHTSFSGDSDADIAAMIRRAQELSLNGICITDHLDYDYPDDPDLFLLDLPAYTKALDGVRSSGQYSIPVRSGIEIGLQPHLADTHRKLLEEYRFDFVIGSSHVVHGIDPYYPHYYEGRSEEEAYMEYFASIPENILAFDDFDVYGHLDYVVRYGPTKNQNYSYEAYREIIDEILRLLISRGKGLEVNTAGLKYGLGHPNPTEAVLTRYRELGGEILTIGSDAHQPEHIAYAFDRIPDLLRSCGFRYYTVFRERKPQFLAL